MKKLVIYGSNNDDGTFHMEALHAVGDWVGDDAQNTAMNVLRMRAGVLIWDEGTWDDYTWA